MFKLLGVVFFIIIVESVLVLFNFMSGNSFLFSFVEEQSLSIMGSMLALNLPTATFLIAHLMDMESKFGKELFSYSKREIKHNVLYMICTFLVQLFVLSSIPSITQSSSIVLIRVGFFMKCLSLFFFLTYIFALYEMSICIFNISKVVFEKKK